MNDPTKTPVRREQNKLRTAAPKDLTGVYCSAEKPWPPPPDPPDIDAQLRSILRHHHWFLLGPAPAETQHAIDEATAIQRIKALFGAQ